MSERTTPGTRVVLSIAGSDSSGGAGIQAHLKTLAAMDVYGASAITAITAQNTKGVTASLLLDPKIVEQQIDAVSSDLKVNATVTGMMGNSAIVEAVVGAIKRGGLQPLVVDPVMVTKTGAALLDDAAITLICKKLLPLAAIVTPNRAEAARLLGHGKPIEDVYGATEAAKEICKRFGARACLVKGIKRPDASEGEAVDVFFDGAQVLEVKSAWRPTENTHGAGCTLAAAIAGALALGQPLNEAVQTGKNVVSEAIRQATDLGNGRAPVNHLAYLKVKK